MPSTRTSSHNAEKPAEEQFDVGSSNPQERIMARRNRIARRAENIRRMQQQQLQEADGVVEAPAEEETEKTEVQNQIEKSAEVLEKILLESEEIITNVRVANDGREVDRRENEGVVREKIIEQLEQEAQAAQDMFNEIANKWTNIYNYSDPLTIHEELLAQKEKCDELIRQKDGIIAMLKEDIKRTERQFSEDQIRQNEDIATLTHRIEDQVSLLRRAYTTELYLMENVILFERDLLIKANDQKWEDLYKQRDELETANIDLRYVNDQKHIQNMIKLRIDHEESYRKTRILLETDINKLEQELECIKALCLMNSEKLDYNYQILAKRENENLIIKSQQKRRINKLSDLINVYKNNISEYTNKSAVEMKRLNEQVFSLRKGVRDTEEKLKYFSKTNDSKYKQIWNLNYKKAEYLLKRILKVDCLLYEQQLGKTWNSPEVQLLKMKDLSSYRHALKVLNIKSKAKIRTDDTTSTVESGLPPFNTSSNYSGLDKYYAVTRNKLLQHILKLISDKSGFLVEKRLKLILSSYDPDPKYLIRIDSLFSALGIDSKADIDDLIEFFLPYTECKICEMETSTLSSEKEVKVEFLDTHKGDETHAEDIVDGAMQAVQVPENKIELILLDILPEAEESVDVDASPSECDSRPSLQASRRRRQAMRITCHKQHPLVVNSGFVLRALSDFITNYYNVRGMAGPQIQVDVTTKNPTVSRILKKGDVLKFWKRFHEVFNPAKEQLWDGILCGIQKYLLILKDRKNINDEIVVLRRQNMELKHLLSSYIKNHEKHAPCNLPNHAIPKIVTDFSKE